MNEREKRGGRHVRLSLNRSSASVTGVTIQVQGVNVGLADSLLEEPNASPQTLDERLRPVLITDGSQV